MNVAKMMRNEMTDGAFAAPGLGSWRALATTPELDDTLPAESGTPGEEL